MTTERHEHAKAVLYEASKLAPERRLDYVRAECGEDEELRSEVESLLGFLDNPPDEVEVGNYRLVRQLGEGGMGVVWEAEQIRPLRRRVALKIIRRELVTPEILGRFEAERQALAVMEHPNIATVFDAGAAADGRPFFAMEYVDGEPITSYCDTHSLGVEARLELFVRVCRGVEHAHERGIIHRDLKPSNLLVTVIDGRPVPKVIDFGVAKATSGPISDIAEASRSGRWVGTPEYMSPEQAMSGGRGVDARTDVYALGVVLYELLAGCRPYGPLADDDGIEEIRRRMLEATPTRPSSRVSSSGDGIQPTDSATDRKRRAAKLKGNLDRIALKALARDPSSRYSSCAELAEDVERHLEGRAPRAGGTRRGWAAALLVALLTLAGLFLLARGAPEPGEAPLDAALASVQRAQELLTAGSPEDLGRAIDHFESALRIDPELAVAYSGLAESKLLLARRGDLPMEQADRDAAAALKRALAIDPELAAAHSVLGLQRSQMGDLEGAEVALRRAIELDEGLAIAHLRLGGVLSSQHQTEEADGAYRRALELDPLSLQAHHASAGNLMSAGRYEDGLLGFQRWLRIEPDSAETYRRMSLWARTYGHLDDAVAWARRAVDIDPKAPLNVHELIMANSSLGRFDEATRWMDHAYELAPNNHWTFTLKAFQLLERGDFDELERFMQEQLAIDPPVPGAPLSQIVRVRMTLAARSKVYQEDYRAAVDLSEQALGTPFSSILETGFDANAFVFLAFAYQQLGESDRAAQATARALSLIESRQGWIWKRLIMADTLAAIRVLEGNDDEAVRLLDQAVEDGWAVGYGVLRFSPLFERLHSRDDYRALVAGLEARLAEMRAALV